VRLLTKDSLQSRPRASVLRPLARFCYEDARRQRRHLSAIRISSRPQRDPLRPAQHAQERLRRRTGHKLPPKQKPKTAENAAAAGTKMSEQVEKADKAAVKAAIQKMSKQVEQQDAAAPAAASKPKQGPQRPPFAVSYDPKDVAELASRLTLEEFPVVQLETGELRLAPQFHLIGRCGNGFISCQCETEPRGADYVYTNLPDPINTSMDALVRRWCCLVKNSPAMGGFAADQWYNAHGSRTLQAIEKKSDTLVTCVDGYVDNLIDDPNLATLARLAGLPDGVQTSYAISVISREAKQARSAFLAGDWALVTRLGGTLLHIAIQTSDPADVPSDDEDIQRLFAAVDILQSVLSSGYSKDCWRLAPESSRAGFGFACASKRLPEKPDCPIGEKPEGYDDVD
jgi:hypothetical protein